MYDRKKPLKVQIESVGPWSEKDREMFIQLLSEAIARYLSIPENREKIRAQIAERTSENHD